LARFEPHFNQTALQIAQSILAHLHYTADIHLACNRSFNWKTLRLLIADMSQSPRIAQLAEDITKSVTKLLEILSTQGVPAPSFDDDGPFFLPKEASNAQDIILDATAELHELLMEPLNLVYKQGGVSD
jgi:hypothetical protein